MRKLSETFAAPALPCLDGGQLESWQSLILFDGVLKGESLLASEEVGKLLVYFYGQPRITEVQTKYTEELHGWLMDELYKADVNCRAMIYPFKASFEEMKADDCKDNYTAPLYITMFKPGIPGVEYDFLVLTCSWEDDKKLFKNYQYIVGVIADTDDLITVVDEHLRRD